MDTSATPSTSQSGESPERPGTASEDLQGAYEGSVFWVHSDTCYIPVRIGQTSPELEALLDAKEADCWAFITACNPGSLPLAPPENERRQEALRRRLEELGFAPFPGMGVGTGGDWPPEASYLVLRMPPEQAAGLGRELGQNAIVVGSRGRAAELLWC